MTNSENRPPTISDQVRDDFAEDLLAARERLLFGFVYDGDTDPVTFRRHFRLCETWRDIVTGSDWRDLRENIAGIRDEIRGQIATSAGERWPWTALLLELLTEAEDALRCITPDFAKPPRPRRGR